MITELSNILNGFTLKEKIGTTVFFIILMITQVITGSSTIALIASIMGFLYVT